MGRFAAYDWAKGVVHTGKSDTQVSTLDVQSPIILYERIIILNENEDEEDEAEINETLYGREELITRSDTYSRIQNGSCWKYGWWDSWILGKSSRTGNGQDAG